MLIRVPRVGREDVVEVRFTDLGNQPQSHVYATLFEFDGKRVVSVFPNQKPPTAAGRFHHDAGILLRHGLDLTRFREVEQIEQYE